MKKSYTEIAFNDFDIDLSDWELSTYSYSGGKLHMQESDSPWTKRVYWNKNSNHDYQTIKIKLTLNDKNSIFRFGKFDFLQPINVEVDFENDVLRLYDLNQVDVIKSKSIGFSTAADTDYILKITLKSNDGFDLNISDYNNYDNLHTDFTDAATINNIGIMAGKPFMSLNKGDVSVHYFQYRCDIPKYPKIVCVGDSLTEAHAIVSIVGMSALPFRWGTLMYNDIRSRVSISGLAGEDIYLYLNDRIDYEVIPFHPEYCLIIDYADPTDYLLFKSTYTTICEKLEANGIIPILSTAIPRYAQTYESYIAVINDIIINVLGRRYVDINKALSLNNDCKTFDVTNRTADKVHFNILGNQLVYNQIKVDCPYLFDKKIR